MELIEILEKMAVPRPNHSEAVEQTAVFLKTLLTSWGIPFTVQEFPLRYHAMLLQGIFIILLGAVFAYFIVKKRPILALVAFFALIALRLVPIYLESFKVSSHIVNLAEDSATKSLTNAEIQSTLKKRFQLDDVTNVSASDVVIERQGDDMTISIEYEVRTSAIGNVDMVITFSEEAEVK